MQDKYLELMIENIKDALKNIPIRDGDILAHADEHHRLHISPYRLNLEIRFPEGIQNIKK